MLQHGYRRCRQRRDSHLRRHGASDLLTRADARAGELAAAYDRALIVGKQCAREYDSLISEKH
ncbi:DUF2514 family protein [Pseudomonas sp. NPDC089408]|uniref:DUF2514 family protein n=1 Tax=Pseudomonas sp. NPDC089408 TaxID=3364465 RepID=UPI0037FBA2B0